MKSDENGRNGRSHTHFYVREHGADSRTQADKKGEKQRYYNSKHKRQSSYFYTHKENFLKILAIYTLSANLCIFNIFHITNEEIPRKASQNPNRKRPYFCIVPVNLPCHCANASN